MILAFSGHPGAGKTSLSTATARQLGWGWASFGEHVRSVALAAGREPTRENLQILGERMVADETREFCVAVLDRAAWSEGTPVVLDGIRHLEILRELQRIADPQPVRLVLVDTDLTVRLERLKATEKELPESLYTLDTHSTERQVEIEIRGAAELVLDGSLPIYELVDEVRGWIISKHSTGRT